MASLIDDIFGSDTLLYLRAFYTISASLCQGSMKLTAFPATSHCSLGPG